MNDVEKKQFSETSVILQETISSGEGLHNSLIEGIEGYVQIPSVLRSWSYKGLAELDWCPTHIFVAEGDVQTPASGSRYIHSQLHGEGKRIKVFEEGGHMTLVFCFDKCIDSFVRESMM